MNEWRTNYILWAIAKAPLLLSTNLTALANDHPTLMPLLANSELIAINQDSAGVQARKLSVDGRALGRPVGVEACAAPDLLDLAAGAGETTEWNAHSMGEVSAAKQRWHAVSLDPAAPSTVQLRNAFYSSPAVAHGEGGKAQPSVGPGRCLAMQQPNSIAYSPPYRHPTRPNPRPVWSAHWQAVLRPCNASDQMQQW